MIGTGTRVARAANVDPKAKALKLAQILHEYSALTSEQLWGHAQLHQEFHSKRHMKYILRWMKENNIVQTKLPFKQSENRVFILSGELPTLEDRLASSEFPKDAQQEYTGICNRDSQECSRIQDKDARFWSRYSAPATPTVPCGARPIIPRDKLRLKANRELRGLAPLMPFWDI